MSAVTPAEALATTDEVTTRLLADLEDSLTALLGDVWGSLLGEDAALEPAEHEPAPGSWVGRVHIDGAWRGTVAVALGPAAARALAEALLADPDERATSAPGEDDVRDAVGELANVVGGNVKALLEEPHRLSLPEAGPGLADPPGHGVALRRSFRWGPHPITVTVLRAGAPESPASPETPHRQKQEQP
jgi:chemotaxis protein CheX